MKIQRNDNVEEFRKLMRHGRSDTEHAETIISDRGRVMVKLTDNVWEELPHTDDDCVYLFGYKYYVSSLVHDVFGEG